MNNKDGKYQISYTTCPEKSFIVKPTDGEINYDRKNTNKLVNNIINGEVEKI